MGRKARIEAESRSMVFGGGMGGYLARHSGGNMSGSFGGSGRRRKPGRADISPGGRRQIARIEADMKAGKISNARGAKMIGKIR